LKKIQLVLCIHNHQPVGNFDFVFEEAYQKAYEPFLRLQEQFPQLKFVQHYTGILAQWIAEHHPDFFDRMKALAQAGRVEIMTGGFYEPILSAIPPRDGIGQIVRLSRYMQQKTGYAPAGAWLAERVWEPQLPEVLVDAGVDYTVMDDVHFKLAGLGDDELFGYYTTEHMGKIVRVFPISERLRYSIPARSAEETIEYLHSVATRAGDRLLVFADDGEKFGAWPGSWKQCHEEEWLASFFGMIAENRDWIEVVTFQEALQRLQPLGMAYLPTASYREMTEWALPTAAIHRQEEFNKWLKGHRLPADFQSLVAGGFWRNFLAKYPESNAMHKHMLRCSDRAAWLQHQGAAEPSDDARKRDAAMEEVLDHLYAAQCNCPYWHGVFGGLYLPHLRYPIHHHLLQANALMDRMEKSNAALKMGWVEVESVDFDSDGHEEVLVETDRMSLYAAPRLGGSLFYWGLKGKALNLFDSMTRREEGYHRRLRQSHDGQEQARAGIDPAGAEAPLLQKENDLDQFLNYDWYRRTSLLDHFLHPHTTLDEFARARYGEQGDFVNQPYDNAREVDDNVLRLTLDRCGHVWIGTRFVPIRVSKTLTIRPKTDLVEVLYRISNNDSEPAELRFGTESVFALLAGMAHDRYFYSPGYDVNPRHLASSGSLGPLSQFGLRDEWLGVDILMTLEKPAEIWRFPIETVSMSEGGFERVYQCSVVMPIWKLALEPGGSWACMMQFAVK
jgi:4-alpha-glucanotransferase